MRSRMQQVLVVTGAVAWCALSPAQESPKWWEKPSKTEVKSAAPPVADHPDFKWKGDMPPRAFRVDLDGDGKPEIIRLVLTGKADEGEFFHLKVLGPDMKPLWTGPKEMDSGNKLVFGNWDFGSSLPEVVGDYDGDGAVELLAPAPVSDVSPVGWRLLRWKDGGFVPVRMEPLKEYPENSGNFPWSVTEEMSGTWISHFLSIGPDGCVARLTNFDGTAGVKAGVALMEATPKGFRLKRWIEKLAVPGPAGGEGQEAGRVGEKAQDGAPGAARQEKSGSGGELAKYLCQIGDEDLRSSRGERLTKVSEILAQDRANYHRYKIRHRRDLDDETFFASARNRELFQQVSIECPQKLADGIIRGGAIVEVTVYPNRIVVGISGD